MGGASAARGLLVLKFKAAYFTEWGQSVVVMGCPPQLGSGSLDKAFKLSCRHVGDRALVWEGVATVPLRDFSYQLAVVGESGELVKWHSLPQLVVLPPNAEGEVALDIWDEWVDRSHPAELLKWRPFQSILGPPPPLCTLDRMPVLPGTMLLRFQIWDRELEDGEALCLTGGVPQLGNWQLHEALLMTQTAPNCWEAEVELPLPSLSADVLTYKYAIQRADGNLMLEHGESRMLSVPEGAMPEAGSTVENGLRDLSPGGMTIKVQNDGYFRREERWRGAGVAVPVFSLRTDESLGCGEFLDIIKLVDFCCRAGLHLIQVLPVNDTSVRKTWRDSYPYSAICVFALHPMYVRLDSLPGSSDPDFAARIQQARHELDNDAVNYEATMAVKLRLARAIFDKLGSEATSSSEFQGFVQENKEWLQPYAVFCFLRDLFGTAEHWTWGALVTPTPEALERLTSVDRDWHASIMFTYWLQFHLHKQLLEASSYAQAHGVVLKGDLPIGVDKRSVETWLYPDLFRMNVSIGAPPDQFDPKGQNWDFPSYNWEAMAADGYLWWRRRLTHMAQYFQALRVDHILGFFRIWEIPGSCSMGLLGRFRPSAPIHRHELDSRGIWDLDRLCDPYVTQGLLVERFGKSLAGELSKAYFEPSAGGRLKFKSQFDREKAILAIQAPVGATPVEVEEVEFVKAELLALRQNVVLLRDPSDPISFYPRIQFEATSSFHHLDPNWQKELAALRDDYFNHRQDGLWRTQAHSTLPVLMTSSDMLICGEDLGMIPSCVHPVMADLGLTGLRIQRMPSEPDSEFGDPANYPYMVVASPSSHDTSVVRAWYAEDMLRRKRFWTNMLGNDIEAPPFCTPDVMRQVIQQHLDSPAVLAIFPIQDIMALSADFADVPPEEQQINDPTNPAHYWRYRIHRHLEELMQHQLCFDFREMVYQSGRHIQANSLTD